MASDEPFSDILPGWVARQALRIRARPLGASPTSLGLTEPVATPSRRAVQQLAAPGQLDEERRTGVVAAVHAAALYRVSRFCRQDSHAGGRAMQAATEAECVESDESVASASAFTAIIEEK